MSVYADNSIMMIKKWQNNSRPRETRHEPNRDLEELFFSPCVWTNPGACTSLYLMQ